jgi:hypothetical protein
MSLFEYVRFSLRVIVVKVTQNWSLEAKIMFAGTVKIGARMVKIGARFWTHVGSYCCCKNRRPILENRGPILRADFFSETYFWARFGTILWEFLLL